jgi:hypothetical protein
MKKNKQKLSAVERFQRDLATGLELYYRQTLSDRAKRAWQRRKQLSTSSKVAM